MRRVSLREFQLHPKKHLDNLPLVLTIYGKGIVLLTPFEDVLTESANTNPKSVNRISNVLTEAPRKVLTDVSTQSPEPEDEPLVTPKGMRLSGKKASCPICYEPVPVELATQHYTKLHEDI